MRITVPISVGEYYDKLSILRLKLDRLDDPKKRVQVQKEHDALWSARPGTDIDRELVASLDDVNTKLWDMEEDIRTCEKRQDFGPRFVELARSIYTLNDARAAIKRRINLAAGSDFFEEKSY